MNAPFVLGAREEIDRDDGREQKFVAPSARGNEPITSENRRDYSIAAAERGSPGSLVFNLIFDFEISERSHAALSARGLLRIFSSHPALLEHEEKEKEKGAAQKAKSQRVACTPAVN